MDSSFYYDAEYFLRGKQTGKSLYENYRWMPDLTIPMAARIVSHCGIDPSDTILDFGCASGYLVRALRELEYTVYGYDISQWANENADRTIRDYLLDWSALHQRLSCFDWVIAKDVLEHIDNLDYTIGILKNVRKGILVVVPLAHGKQYDVSEYEKDVTHIHRRPLQWWVGHFHQVGWSVEARYRVEGIKDNYSQYPTGNGFIVARRIA